MPLRRLFLPGPLLTGVHGHAGSPDESAAQRLGETNP